MQVTVQSQTLGTPSGDKRPDKKEKREKKLRPVKEKRRKGRPASETEPAVEFEEDLQEEEVQKPSHGFLGRKWSEESSPRARAKRKEEEPPPPTGMADLAFEDVSSEPEEVDMGPQPEEGSPLSDIVDSAPEEEHLDVPHLARSLGFEPESVEHGEPAVQVEFDPVPEDVSESVPGTESAEEAVADADAGREQLPDEVVSGAAAAVAEAEAALAEAEAAVATFSKGGGSKPRETADSEESADNSDEDDMPDLDFTPKRKRGLALSKKERPAKKEKPVREPKPKKEKPTREPRGEVAKPAKVSKRKRGKDVSEPEGFTVGEEAEVLREQQGVEYREPGVSLLVAVFGCSAVAAGICYIAAMFLF